MIQKQLFGVFQPIAPEVKHLYQKNNNFFNLQLPEKLRLSVTGSCNSSCHQCFMPEKICKHEISENISQNFHDQ